MFFMFLRVTKWIVNQGRYTFSEKDLLSSGMSRNWNAKMS